MELRRMREEEWPAWLERSRAAYAQQMVTMGEMGSAEAREKAAADFAHLLPDGVATKRHHLLAAEHGGEVVGYLWLGERWASPDGPVGWVYDVEVLEPFRRRGHGRALMRLAEEEVRRLGLAAIGLNVFAGNTGAIALYADLGYVVTRAYPGARNMLKRLPPRPASPGR
jgi:ribosomal protein S18 acetylase RimI-like enzyme